MPISGGVFGYLQTPQITTGNPATVNDATAKMPIGGKFTWNGATYRYVKHSAGVAAVAGAPAYAKTLTPAATTTAKPAFTVSPKAADTIIGKLPVGVYLNVPTDAYFCCIQIGGKATVYVAGAIEGDVLVGGTTDAAFEKIAEGSNLTQVPVGKVLEGTSSASLSSAWLMGMDF